MSDYDTATRDDSGEIISCKGRLIWPNLLEAKQSRKFPDRAPQFGSGLLLPAGANIDAIKEEIDRVGKEVHGVNWKKNKSLNLCLKKTGDNEKLAEFAEKFPLFLSAAANADFPPFVFGPDALPFKGSSSEVYGGRWAVISGSAWGVKTGNGNIGWNLNRVQLLDHDEPIAGGRVATSSGFKKVAVAAGKAPASPTSNAAATTGGEQLADSTDDLWA